ncbi:uncharacterized protein LOC110880845 [Helianthus annuus]|uniref:uncharacterized protein LOC110880845 n=1 Tax=Helianthus annuus TaxID=4232 RepID=UPI00165336FE|nr:uncharacterized protein LOC110880845 [Helianthus annuus]
MREGSKSMNLAIKMPISLGNNNYGYGNLRNVGYGNNRQPRNNNQRNRNEGFYNNSNNNGNPNRIPRFVGQGNQGGNREGNRGGNRRDNRRSMDQEVEGPRRLQQPPRGVNDRFRSVVTDNDSLIVCERRMFDCKPHYINILPHFNGRTNDEPYTHLAEFSAICSTNRGHDFALEEVKLRLFQFSLKNKAKQWFLTLPVGSIPTWAEMLQVFLDEYYSMAKTDDARDEIRGLDDETWNHLESTSNGTLLSNHKNDDWEFLERMSKRSKAKESADRAKKHSTSRSWPDRDASSKDRIEMLEQELARMKKKEVGAVQYDVCEECGDIGHQIENCQATVDVNQVYGDQRQYDMNSNTYHPGLRNHPNFRYGNASNQMNPNFQSGNQGGYSHQTCQGGNQGGYQRNNQRGGSDLNAKIDAMLSMMQEYKKDNEIRDKSHEALAKQVDQLAEEVAQMRGSIGRLPSDNTMNPKHQSSSTSNVRNVHISAVSLLSNDEVCSSVESIPPPQCVDGVVENTSDESESKNEQETISQIKIENMNKNSFCENCLNQINSINASKLEEQCPLKDERWEIFKQAKINFPLLDDIKKVPANVECLKELSIEKRHNKLPEPIDLVSHVSVVLSSALPQKAQVSS